MEIISNYTKTAYDIYGLNAGYVAALYERYRQNPESVDEVTRVIFQRWPPSIDGDGRGLSEMPTALAVEKVVGAVNLAQAIRLYGHLDARLDPLGSEPPGDPALDAAYHGVTEDELRGLPASLIGGPGAAAASNALEAIQSLRAIYSATIGYDFDHLHDPEERSWLRDAAESRRFRPTEETFDPVGLLKRLTQIETFELFLHRIFPGKYRFSVEGLDMLIPILDEIICEASGQNIINVLVGMAHRGRLNVLAHVLDKPYSEILAEFKDPLRRNRFEGELGWMGDVKYHKGGQHTIMNDMSVRPRITMPPNPSHVEIIGPVVQGMARAVGTRVDEKGLPRFDPSITLPPLLDG